MPRALIIGAGVAGPVTAMFLRRAGWDVAVFESDPEPDPFAGLFLNVATNGLAVLEQLGLRDRLVSDAHRAPIMVMRSGTGRELGRVPNGPAGDLARGSVIVRRGWAHQVIREGALAAGVDITFGALLTAITETTDAVRATFADGRTETGDVLIGADGIWSLTRQWIDPAAPSPVYSGLIGTGGYARVHGLAPTPGVQNFVFGARAFFGYLVRSDGTVYWFANLTKPEPARGSLRDVPSAEVLAELRTLHAADVFPVPQIVANTVGKVGAYPIYDLAGLQHWSRGRVVAVGDAVHATSPSAGQGASLALEDAITLARSLRDRPTHDAAFTEYQGRRQPRVAEVIRYARAIDRRKRVSKTRLGVAIRDRMMPLFLRNAADDTRNDRLYNHDISWERKSDFEASTRS